MLYKIVYAHAIVTLYFIAGVDFDSIPLTGSIPAGENSTTVVVPIMQDNIIERDEMFFLELQLPTAIPGITLGSANMTTGTITDSTGIISIFMIASIFCLLI